MILNQLKQQLQAQLKAQSESKNSNFAPGFNPISKAAPSQDTQKEEDEEKVCPSESTTAVKSVS